MNQNVIKGLLGLGFALTGIALLSSSTGTIKLAEKVEPVNPPSPPVKKTAKKKEKPVVKDEIPPVEDLPKPETPESTLDDSNSLDDN